MAISSDFLKDPCEDCPGPTYFCSRGLIRGGLARSIHELGNDWSLSDDLIVKLPIVAA
jgi:hypothetical protein